MKIIRIGLTLTCQGVLSMKTKKRRVRFGVLKGEIKIAEDFDAPLPDDLLDLFSDKHPTNLSFGFTPTCREISEKAPSA